MSYVDNRIGAQGPGYVGPIVKTDSHIVQAYMGISFVVSIIASKTDFIYVSQLIKAIEIN